MKKLINFNCDIDFKCVYFSEYNNCSNNSGNNNSSLQKYLFTQILKMFLMLAAFSISLKTLTLIFKLEMGDSEADFK